MTKANHPLALLLAAAMFSLLWVPTLSMPEAQAAAPYAGELA